MATGVHRGCSWEGTPGTPYLLPVEGTEREQTLEILGGKVEAAVHLAGNGPASGNGRPRYRAVFTAPASGS